MMNVWLKYGTYSGTTLSWSSSASFSALEFIDIISTDRIQGVSLRQRYFDHIKSSRTTWKLTISADELADSSNYTFIKAFFKGQAWKFSTDNWTTETEVVLQDAGNLPVTFMENLKELPEVTLTLIQREAD